MAALDLIVQAFDMWEETPARRRFGGLSRGEYILHVALTAIHAMTLTVTALARSPGDFLAAAPQAFAPTPVGASVVWLLLPGALLLALLHQVLLLPRFRRSES